MVWRAAGLRISPAARPPLSTHCDRAESALPAKKSVFLSSFSVPLHSPNSMVSGRVVGICHDIAPPNEGRSTRNMNPPVASVVIPPAIAPRALASCLDAFAAQTLPHGSFEVIVVDDGSEPPLALDPAHWAEKFDLKLLRQQNTGPAGARNRGVAEARGEFIAFTDDDCLPTRTWFENLVAAFRVPRRWSVARLSTA